MNTFTQFDSDALNGSFYDNTSFPFLSAAFTGSDSLEYSTTDGGVITHTDCVNAVSNGAGIFIGEYFVGLTEGNNLFGTAPFIRY